MGIASDLVILVVAGLLFGYLAHLLKMPPLLGYIVAGIAVGPYSFHGGITVSEVGQLELLAEIGTALLLFSLGLELSFKDLGPVRWIALLGTPIQLVLTGLFGFILGLKLEQSTSGSIWLGCIVSLSSTMVVLKTLMNQGQSSALAGRIMLGVLLVQDLAAIPMMVILPEMETGENSLNTGLRLFGLAALLLTAIVFIGTRAIPFLLKHLACLLSRELFFMGVAAIALGVSYLTHVAGLSFALGAFIAGIIVSESDYSHQALSDIAPLRDLFGLIFFASIGMLLNPTYLIENPVDIASILVLVVGLKATIFLVLTRIFGYGSHLPLLVGVGLAQIGEFSFILMRLGLQHKALDEKTYSSILTVAVFSMILTPFVMRIAPPFYSIMRRKNKQKMQIENTAPTSFARHIVIAGAGRVGAQTALVLSRLELPFLLIENHPKRFEHARRSGFPIVYGDAASPEVLAAVSLEEARLLIMAMPDARTTQSILQYVKALHPDLHVIARAEDMDHIADLYEKGVFEVIQPEFEAGMELIRQALRHLKMPALEMELLLEKFRREFYKPDNEEDLNRILKSTRTTGLLDIHWILIEEGCWCENKSIKQLEIRKKTGLSVIAISRNGKVTINPEPDFVFRASDMVAIMGNQDQYSVFESMARKIHAAPVQ